MGLGASVVPAVYKATRNRWEIGGRIRGVGRSNHGFIGLPVEPKYPPCTDFMHALPPDSLVGESSRLSLGAGEAVEGNLLAVSLWGVKVGYNLDPVHEEGTRFGI
jgi:hypothetical protein